MIFDALIKRIDHDYPDGSLAKAASTLPGGANEGVPCDDFLAVAIVSLIYYSFDQEKPDSEQLLSAAGVIDSAKHTLAGISSELWFDAVNKRFHEERSVQ